MDAVNAVREKLAGVEMGAQTAAARENRGLSMEKDQKESARDTKFGDVWNKLQAQYGGKAEKPREIKKTLGKDDFMRIMIEQMKHQDPSEPFKAEKFASELAQYASVEQLSNMNNSLAKMQTANQPLERLAMTNMIGKQVTIDKERFQHAEGSKEALTFNLAKDASKVSVAVVSSEGEVLVQKELGELKSGPQAFAWDGLRENQLPAKGGTYMLRVSAYDDKGAALQTQTQTASTVVGVAFEGTEPFLLVGDINKPDKVAMRQVMAVQSVPQSMPPAFGAGLGVQPSAQPGMPAAAPGAAPSAKPAPAAPTNGMITFQKGVGSKTSDLSSLDPRIQAAYQKAAQARGIAAPEEEVEKGFPSGLNEKGGN